MPTEPSNFFLLLLWFTLVFHLIGAGGTSVSGEKKEIVPSEDYRVFVDGKQIFCYTAKVYDTRFTEGVETFKGNYDGTNSDWELPFSTVSYVCVNFIGEAEVEIHVRRCNFSEVAIRPMSLGISATVKDSVIRFKINKSTSITIEPGGRENKVLHLFANNPDKSKPSENDKNVIYFGPGVHEMQGINLKSDQTLYLDAGAYVYATNKKKENMPSLIFALNASNIKITGRGILDCSRLTTEYNTRKTTIFIGECNHVKIEGITLIGSTIWNTMLFKSSNIVVDNIHIISHFFNSDGINSVLCNNVTIKNCFLRQRDDGIVMKAFVPAQLQKQYNLKVDSSLKTSKVTVENCVLWSDWGYALGASYEIQEPVGHIAFRNCDIIHATHATELQGVIGVLVSDKNTVSDVLFENITIERSLKPIMKLDIKSTKWTKSSTLGNIRDIRFRNITYLGKEVHPVILDGYGENSTIEDILFENIVYNGQQVKSINNWNFKINRFVKGIQFK